ncbi:holo-ACP synthase [Evansella vedderi]|nr:holo-ACP synthase [Evansella vedderi]
MITGIGLDLVEMDRIRSLYERQSSFVNRVLTERELTYFKTLSDRRKIEFLAGRFSAKEALAKANGSGIGESLSFQDIHILNDEKGKPYIVSEKINQKIHLSITHTQNYAAAQVVLEE